MFPPLFFAALLASSPRRVTGGELAGLVLVYLVADLADRTLEDLRR